MVESGTQGKHTNVLREAIRSSLDAGATPQELFDNVTTILDEVGHHGNGSPAPDNGDLGSESGNTVQVYEKVPPHLITITDAADEQGVTRQAVYLWLEKGYIREAGFLRAGDAGRRNVTLLDRAELATLASTEPFVLDRSELPLYHKLPEGLIDLPAAAKKYKKNVHTMRGWVRRGLVRQRGRLKAPATGGGYLVVSEVDLVEHMATPPNKGGRPPKA